MISLKTTAIHQPTKRPTVGMEKPATCGDGLRQVQRLLHGKDVTSTAIHTDAHIVSAAIYTLNDES